MTNDEWGARNINPCALVFGRLREEIGQKKARSGERAFKNGMETGGGLSASGASRENA